MELHVPAAKVVFGEQMAPHWGGGGKMAAVPRKWPHGKRKWGHPRWRPEAELLCEPSYVWINAPWHKILVHTRHRYIAFTVSLSMAQRGLVIDKFVCVFIFQTSQRHNSSHMITCVLHRKQDIFFQTQKTIPTLAHDIALIHWQEVFYRHFWVT